MASMVLLFRSGLANLHALPSKFASKPAQNKALFMTWNRVLGTTSKKNDSKLRSLKNWDYQRIGYISGLRLTILPPQNFCFCHDLINSFTLRSKMQPLDELVETVQTKNH